jgi:glucokinase
LPCAVGNDTDLAAVAEARVGGRQYDRCVFYTNIGSGIGGGLVVDGQLYARPRGAMEVGHNRVYSLLDQRHGILEEFCSGWALNRRAQAAAQQDEHSLMWSLTDHRLEAIDASTLFDAWEQHDAAATQVVDCFLDCYARTMSNAIALLNPDVIIIGGGVAQRGAPLLGAIRDHMREFTYEPFAATYRIELTSLGKQAVPVGALLLAAENS